MQFELLAEKKEGSFQTLLRLLTTQYYFISEDALLLIKFPIDRNIPAPQKHLWEQEFSPNS